MIVASPVNVKNWNAFTKSQNGAFLKLPFSLLLSLYSIPLFLLPLLPPPSLPSPSEAVEHIKGPPPLHLEALWVGEGKGLEAWGQRSLLRGRALC